MNTCPDQFQILEHNNHIEWNNVSAAAHIITIRVESFSYMGGMAVATAAATMVGQSLGMKDERRAVHSTYLGYLVGGAYMAACALAFIFLGHRLTAFMTSERETAAL